jgi:hypothetical protein
MKKTEAYFGDKGTFYENKPLCETCYYEDEPCATVFYGKDDQPYFISRTRNETDDDFRVGWRSTDAWRGYYKTESDKYSPVNTAEVLAYHESEKMLKSFHERVKELFDEHNIDYASIFSRSSNVFCQNYDLYVKKGQEVFACLLIADAKAEVDYNNQKWQRNIVFDEDALNKLAELFPEREIKTDYDAMRLIEELGDNALAVLQTRLKEKSKTGGYDG